MKELSVIKDFILSLEKQQLTGDQQAVLLVGENEYYGGTDASGCSNTKCTNNTHSCRASSNSSCVNIPNCTCEPTESDTAGCNTGKDCGCPVIENPTNCVINTSNCTVNICKSKSGIGFGSVGFPGFDM